MLEVIEPGLFSTIQDEGRPGQGHLGVTRAGAADDLALSVANLLVGNDVGAPALEMTLLGGRFLVHRDSLVSITGADMEARVTEDDRALSTGRSHHLRAGTTLAFGGAIDGARTYLALAGGIAADEVLDSRSTDPVAGFGGLGGHALQTGDLVRAAGWRSSDGARASAGARAWPDEATGSGVAPGPGPRRVAVVPGPHLEALPDAVRRALSETLWTVTPRSDRVGMRLDGPPITGLDGVDLVSLPMLPGAIQVPAGGLPIVLMPDAPTIGGYPVPAVVAEVDRCVLGQLRPGDELRFVWIDAAVARRRAADRAANLLAIAATLR